MEKIATRIPYKEKYQNNKYYGGLYYDVLRRDGFRCQYCGSNININVHHITGFDSSNKTSYEINSMITLCRKCHSKEHAHPHMRVTDHMLKNIGFDFSNYKNIDRISNNSGNKKINQEYR